MKRITEAQIRQVIREEIAGLLNEIRETPNVAGSESKGGPTVIFEMKGKELIEKLKKIKRQDRVFTPLPLQNFEIDYDSLSAREREEINKIVVLSFEYDDSLSHKGYLIKVRSLSDASIKRGEQGKKLAAYEFMQMVTVVSDQLDRQAREIKNYENVLGIDMGDIVNPTKLSRNTPSYSSNKTFDTSGTIAGLPRTLKRSNQQA